VVKVGRDQLAAGVSVRRARCSGGHRYTKRSSAAAAISPMRLR
jgi:hypothetical protein